jgi:hypothetical protein
MNIKPFWDFLWDMKMDMFMVVVLCDFMGFNVVSWGLMGFIGV